MPEIINYQLSIINRSLVGWASAHAVHCEARNTRYARRKTRTAGSVLLVVLFVIMAITVLSLGFLTRSDAELACGQNMALRIQMDQLADSGLQHAKGLILNPQDIDISSGSWSATEQQLVAGTNDYYDVGVVRDDSDLHDQCNYIIDCNSYRLSNGEEVGRSTLTAELRLDPCIALWVDGSTTTTLWSGFKVYGDVYCAGNLTNQGTIDGDVFATNAESVVGRSGQAKTPAELTPLLQWPNVTYDDFTSRTDYPKSYISAASIGHGDIPSGTYIFYRSGDLTVTGDVEITGMLIVKGNLVVQGAGNKITAAKNIPALLVTGDLIIDQGASLEITGLAAIDNRALINGAAGLAAGLNVLGGIFIQGIFETAADSSANENTAVLYGAPTWQPGAGKIGGALQFDGIDDYAQTANSPTTLQLSVDYTISVWVKPNATQNPWAGIVSKTDPTGMNNHWTLQLDNTTPTKLIVYHPSANWYTGITISDLVAGGTWHHVTVVRSGNSMESYLDGVPRKTDVWTNPPGDGNGHLNIGADRTASPNCFYKGLIDSVRIYNRALDANAVDRIYKGVEDPNIPIAHWKFDETAPNVTITAAPSKTAIVLWSQAGVRQHWGQAAGAFFRSVRRQ